MRRRLGLTSSPLFPLLIVPVLWSCASGGSVGPPRPSADLSRSDFIVWHSLKQILSRNEIQEAEVGAVCVGLGEAGESPLTLQLVQDFVGTDPPVVSSTACQRTSEGVVFGGTSAILLSFFDVEEVPGRPSVSVRFEMPGGKTSVRRCSLTERAAVRVVRREGGEWVDPMPPSEMDPPPPSVIC